MNEHSAPGSSGADVEFRCSGKPASTSELGGNKADQKDAAVQGHGAISWTPYESYVRDTIDVAPLPRNPRFRVLPTRGNPAAFPRPPFESLVSRSFLRLFMSRMFATPWTVLLEFYLPLHHLLVLSGRVIRPLAGCATEVDYLFGEFSLGHAFNNQRLTSNNLQQSKRKGNYLVLDVVGRRLLVVHYHWSQRGESDSRPPFHLRKATADCDL